MFSDAEWLFFDMGSTLIDEQFAYEQRFQDIAEQAGLPYQQVYDQALSFYRQNQKGDLAVAKMLEIPLTKWHAECERLYPDAVQCLSALHLKYRIGIIANQPAGSRMRLKKFGLLPFIDLIIASAEEGVAKPDPAIFEIALQKSGCSPQHAVMIGDRIDNDIIPAKKLGMKTIWIRQGFGRYWQIASEHELPDRIVDTLTELIE